MHRPCHIINFDRDCGDFFYVHISLLAPSHIQQESDSPALAFRGASLQPAQRATRIGPKKRQRGAAIGGGDTERGGQGWWSWSILACQIESLFLTPLIFF